tara:strand:- start:2903 stop:3763 length:861 start_codon:yes stop_codon:yes gene_type:complete
MKFEILKSGLNTTIQDLGRIQGLAYGIPFSGAMDKQSLRSGNSILGNLPTEAAIEFCVIGPSIEFKGTQEIVITGVNLNPTLNNRDIALNEKIKVNENDVLKFKGGNGLGVYGYICFKGRINVPLAWGSKSTYVYGVIGGFKGRALRKGDVLEVIKSTNALSSEETTLIFEKSPVIKIHKGPEYSDFPVSDIKILEESIGEISHDTNRMGARINNIQLQGTSTGNIISSGTIPGTIQIPSSGNPIVLLADSPCTGGYPRIGIIVKEDLDQFCQIKPGSSFNFSWID